MRAEHEINYVFSMFLPVESTLVAHSVLFIIQNHCFAITLQLLDTWSWWYCFLWSPQTSLWHIWCFPSLSADQRKDHCEPAGLRNSQQHTPHQLLVSDWTVWKKRKKKKKTLIEHISSSPTLNSLFQSCVTISLKADSSDQMDLRSTGEWKRGSETIRRYFPEDLMWTVNRKRVN